MTGLLLDSHVFLWWAHQPELLTPAISDALASPENALFLSVASAWELAIKENLGKLSTPKGLEETLRLNDISLLPINLAHIDIIRSLPRHHGDPFDRLLIAQAQHEKLTLVSRDRWFQAYDVALITA